MEIESYYINFKRVWVGMLFGKCRQKNISHLDQVKRDLISEENGICAQEVLEVSDYHQ
jgi:hypothetical protein